MLFDNGASHSFISMLFASVLDLEYEDLYSIMYLDTSIGEVARFLWCVSPVIL